jgi:hypothetical protein
MGVEDDRAILLIKKMQGAQLHGKKDLAEVGAPWAVGRDGGGCRGLCREQGRVHAGHDETDGRTNTVLP